MVLIRAHRVGPLFSHASFLQGSCTRCFFPPLQCGQLRSPRISHRASPLPAIRQRPARSAARQGSALRWWRHNYFPSFPLPQHGSPSSFCVGLGGFWERRIGCNRGSAGTMKSGLSRICLVLWSRGSTYWKELIIFDFSCRLCYLTGSTVRLWYFITIYNVDS